MMPATYDFYDANPATRHPKIIHEEFRHEEGILYIKVSGTITNEDLCQHYTRLAANLHDLHQQGLKALIYDLREIDPIGWDALHNPQSLRSPQSIRVSVTDISLHNPSRK